MWMVCAFPGQKGVGKEISCWCLSIPSYKDNNNLALSRRRSRGENLWSESADFLRFRQTLPLLLVFALWHSLSTKVSITPCKFTYQHIIKKGCKDPMLSLSMADNAFPYRKKNKRNTQKIKIADFAIQIRLTTSQITKNRQQNEHSIAISSKKYSYCIF